jgi:5-methylcytosine-specific restriction endonuclease McrA
MKTELDNNEKLLMEQEAPPIANVLLPAVLSTVFEQYEFKGYLITIQNYMGTDDLIGFATPTKYAHLLNADNYSFLEAIAEDNGIKDGEGDLMPGVDGDFHYIVLEPDDVVTYLKGIDTKSASSVLDDMVKEILTEHFMNSKFYEDKCNEFGHKEGGVNWITGFEQQQWKGEYMIENSPIVLKQIYKKSVIPKVGKRKTGYLGNAWAALVKERDKKCTECGSVYDLHAHHIKQYKSHPELRNDVNNGITLCGNCHRKWHSENGR